MASDRHPDRRRFLRNIGGGTVVCASLLSGCAAPSSDQVTAESGDGAPDDGSRTEPTDDAGDDQYDLGVEHDLTTWERYDPEWKPPDGSPAETDLTATPVITGLEIPWDLAFAPNGDLFISERVGRIRRFAADTLDSVIELDDVVDGDAVDPGEEGGWWAAGSEGGLMGITVHPNYPDVPLVYAVYTYDADDGPRNRVSYFDAGAESPLETERVVVDGIPGGRVHNGSRITFGPANYLWIGTGDAEEPESAQDLTSLAGSVLRVEPGGTAPADNPDPGADADGRIYTYGHRNVQGLSFLPDGTPIVTEHGPSGQDEVSVLRPGGNYGWGVADSRDREVYESGDYVPPVVNTGTDTWAPPGGVFYTGGAVPSVRNRFVIGGLRSQRLNVVTMAPRGQLPAGSADTQFTDSWLDSEYDARAVSLFDDEFGRIRHADQGPDGALYVTTSNRDGRTNVDGEDFPRADDDVLYRIEPASVGSETDGSSSE